MLRECVSARASPRAHSTLLADNFYEASAQRHYAASDRGPRFPAPPPPVWGAGQSHLRSRGSLPQPLPARRPGALDTADAAVRRAEGLPVVVPRRILILIGITTKTITGKGCPVGLILLELGYLMQFPLFVLRPQKMRYRVPMPL